MALLHRRADIASGIWPRIEAGMVQTHQSAWAVLGAPPFLRIDIGDGDAFVVLLDVDDLAIVLDQVAQRACRTPCRSCPCRPPAGTLASGYS